MCQALWQIQIQRWTQTFPTSPEEQTLGLKSNWHELELAAELTILSQMLGIINSCILIRDTPN